MIDPLKPDYANTPASGRRSVYNYQLQDPSAASIVSIITPYFNTGAVFNETAASVRRQSFQQWEWIIVNDGSTSPEALAVLNEFRSVDPRIRVIDHDSNCGLSAARNTGLELAHSPYIVLLDSDDLIEPTAIEKWLWYLESHPDVAFVKGLTVGFNAQTYLWSGGFHDGNAFLVQNRVNPLVMLRQVVFQKVGGFDASTNGGLEDWDFWLKSANEGFWGGTAVAPVTSIAGQTLADPNVTRPTATN
jgi:glycosyltransferase involved in cell wall biosynthesis